MDSFSASSIRIVKIKMISIWEQNTHNLEGILYKLLPLHTRFRFSIIEESHLSAI